MRQIFFGAICALIIGIFAWSAEPGFFELASPRARDAYYNLLVQGFQSGQLNVKRDAPPALAKVADPYDPSVNTPLVWDSHYLSYEMSYYKGKLYLYFGVTPALVLFWPYATLTGHYLGQRAAVVIFFAAGFLVAAFLLRGIWRRFFPDTNIWVLGAGVLALGLASGILEILSACDVYEVAKSCAFAFTMFALGALWLALCEPKQQVKWLLLASLAYGLAIGSRPTLLFGAIILLSPAAKEWFVAKPPPRLQILSLLIAAILPITLIGLGLMLYNELRFDSPFEFGWHYQLTSYNNHTARQLSFQYWLRNFLFYFIEPAGWGAHFPFLQTGTASWASPAGYYGNASPYSGILCNYPVVWLAVASPLAWKNRPVAGASLIRWFVVALFLLFVTCASTLCLFFAGVGSYELDFLPALMLLAVIGIFGVERSVAGAGKRRLIARGCWIALLAWSILFNVFASFESRAIAKSFTGDLFLNQGRLDDAAIQYHQALAFWPGYGGAHNGLGSIYLQQGHLDQAVIQYQKALDTNPGFVEALNNLGYCFLKLGRMDDAIAEYNKVLEIQPDFPEARNNLAYCFLQTGAVDGAIVQYEKAVGLKPDSATYQCGLGNAWLQKGQVDKAMAQYQKALEIQPDFPQAQNYLAYCLFLTGHTDDAIVQYQKAIELDPKSAAFHSDLGNVLLQKGDVDGAIAQYQASLALQPGSADVCKRLGDAFFQKGRVSDAIVQYQKALEINPNAPEARNNLGYCFLVTQQWDDAIVQFKKVVQLQPNFVSAYNNLGDAYRARKMAPEAITNYEKAIALQPQFVSAQTHLAWILATWPDTSIRNGRQAVTLAEQANQLSGGNDPQVLCSLAAAEAETGRFPEAISTAEKALSLAQAQSNAALANQLEAEIKLYQKGFPCRSNEN